ncbi:competence pheromone ComX [Lysinibacillus xylanilyticus]|uniref:competence pheromone ComX n=1 Tax=Lysinibacillus xylanilyticus TaxID=582475 RepID=UPI003CFFDE64
MKKLIQYLLIHPNLIRALKENKISLVGVTAREQQAIMEAFNEPIYVSGSGWRGAEKE